uniref:Uncharacterized protein n=1 Tax=Klebsiella pneumoniae TaxID=573 RepID=A0A8E6LAQ4_KLEPN|nr:hypothetical protein [Klebsiella pneumoniae]QVQ58661.1 hypothetical protein [Klebsiella pneumoniae]
MFHHKSLMRKEWQNKKYKLQAGTSVVRVEIKAVFFLTMQCRLRMELQT